MPLIGADSEVPQPDLYAGHDVWAVYLAGDVGHVWSEAEVRELGAHGVRGVLPIVVPPQSDWWSADAGAEVLVRLVAQARAWGLYHGAPLCLDIEEATAEALVSAGKAAAVFDRWLGACATYGYRPWTYGGETWHHAIGDQANRWLASWPAPTPANPNVPAGYAGWQYEGSAENGRIDRDVFDVATYLSTTTLQTETVNEKESDVRDRETGAEIPGTEESPAETSSEESPGAEAAETPVEEEAEKVTSAIDAQSTEAEHTADAPPTPTHAAELRDLASKLAVHVEELKAIAETLEGPKS